MSSVRLLFYLCSDLAILHRLYRVTTTSLICIILCEDWQLCPLLRLLSHVASDNIARFVSGHVAMVVIPSNKGASYLEKG